MLSQVRQDARVFTLDTGRRGELPGTPIDFVDLGDQAAFEVTTMDGECGA